MYVTKMAAATRSEVLNLMNQKDKIEQEIKEMGAILSQNGVGMTESLVDAEGYPLSNIDVYQVRYARNRIICLQIDHKAIMKQIEKGLGDYYASSTSSSNTNVQNISVHSVDNNLQPFARINNITPGSPADEAGLQNEDLLLEFGSINYENFRNMSVLADIVRHSENNEISVSIQRSLRNMRLKLRPHKWNGKGLLGCLITPMESVDR